MKKVLMILAITGMTGFVACDSQTGKTTSSAGTEAEHNSNGENPSGIVNAPTDDTTGASATEKTQSRVGNSDTRGEQNNSKSNTTKNQVLTDSM